MTDLNLIDHLITQPRPLLHTLDSLTTIEPSAPLGHPLSHLPLAAYRRRLRSIVAVATAWGEGGDSRGRGRGVGIRGWGCGGGRTEKEQFQ